MRPFSSTPPFASYFDSRLSPSPISLQPRRAGRSTRRRAERPISGFFARHCLFRLPPPARPRAEARFLRHCRFDDIFFSPPQLLRFLRYAAIAAARSLLLEPIATDDFHAARRLFDIFRRERCRHVACRSSMMFTLPLFAKISFLFYAAFRCMPRPRFR